MKWLVWTNKVDAGKGKALLYLQELKSQDVFRRNLDLKRLVCKREWVGKRSHLATGSKRGPVAELWVQWELSRALL